MTTYIQQRNLILGKEGHALSNFYRQLNENKNYQKYLLLGVST